MRRNTYPFFKTAECAQVIRISRKRQLPFVVLPLFLFPALSLFPGHNPAREARCPAVGKRLISVPMIASMACALVSPVLGISCNATDAVLLAINLKIYSDPLICIFNHLQHLFQRIKPHNQNTQCGVCSYERMYSSPG